MPRDVTSSFQNPDEAEEARRQSQFAPSASGNSAADQPGVFDNLARLIRDPVVSAPAAPAGQAPAANSPQRHAPAAAAAMPAQRTSTSNGTDGFDIQEQVFEFVETAEKLIVEKEVFVREEVVLKKVAESHSEEITDKVRRTEIDVERFGASRGTDEPPREANREAGGTFEAAQEPNSASSSAYAVPAPTPAPEPLVPSQPRQPHAAAEPPAPVLRFGIPDRISRPEEVREPAPPPPAMPEPVASRPEEPVFADPAVSAPPQERRAVDSRFVVKDHTVSRAEPAEPSLTSDKEKSRLGLIVLAFLAALLLAFYIGQYLGSFYP